MFYLIFFSFLSICSIQAMDMGPVVFHPGKNEQQSQRNQQLIELGKQARNGNHEALTQLIQSYPQQVRIGSLLDVLDEYRLWEKLSQKSLTSFLETAKKRENSLMLATLGCQFSELKKVADAKFLEEQARALQFKASSFLTISGKPIELIGDVKTFITKTALYDADNALEQITSVLKSLEPLAPKFPMIAEYLSVEYAQRDPEKSKQYALVAIKGGQFGGTKEFDDKLYCAAQNTKHSVAAAIAFTELRHRAIEQHRPEAILRYFQCCLDKKLFNLEDVHLLSHLKEEQCAYFVSQVYRPLRPYLIKNNPILCGLVGSLLCRHAQKMGEVSWYKDAYRYLNIAHSHDYPQAEPDKILAALHCDGKIQNEALKTVYEVFKSTVFFQQALQGFGASWQKAVLYQLEALAPNNVKAACALALPYIFGIDGIVAINFEKAKRLLQQFVNAKKQNPDALWLQAHLYYKQKKNVNAVICACKAHERSTDPLLQKEVLDFVNRIFREVIIFPSKGVEDASVIKVVEKLAEMGNASAHMWLYFYYQQQKPLVAYTHSVKAMELDPVAFDTPAYRESRALICDKIEIYYFCQQNFEEANKWKVRASECRRQTKPESFLTQQQLLEQWKGYGKKLPPDQKNTFDFAVELFNASKFPEFLKISNLPNVPIIQIMRGCALAACQQEYDEAYSVLRGYLEKQDPAQTEDCLTRLALQGLDVLKAQHLSAAYYKSSYMLQRATAQQKDGNLPEALQACVKQAVVEFAEAEHCANSSNVVDDLHSMFESGFFTTFLKYSQNYKGKVSYVLQHFDISSLALSKRCTKITIPKEAIDAHKKFMGHHCDGVLKSLIELSFQPFDSKTMLNPQEYSTYHSLCLDLVEQLKVLKNKFPDDMEYACYYAIFKNISIFLKRIGNQILDISEINEVKNILLSCFQKNDARSGLYLAKYFQSVQDHKQAFDVYNQLSQEGCRDASYEAGLYCIRNEEYKRAVQFFEEAYAQGSKESLHFKALALHKTGKDQEAIHVFAQSSRENTRFSLASQAILVYLLAANTSKNFAEILVQLTDLCLRLREEKDPVACITIRDIAFYETLWMLAHKAQDEFKGLALLNLGMICHLVAKHAPSEKSEYVQYAKKCFAEVNKYGEDVNLVLFYMQQQEWGEAVNALNRAFKHYADNQKETVALRDVAQRLSADIQEAKNIQPPMKKMLLDILNNLYPEKLLDRHNVDKNPKATEHACKLYCSPSSNTTIKAEAGGILDAGSPNDFWACAYRCLKGLESNNADAALDNFEQLIEQYPMSAGAIVTVDLLPKIVGAKGSNVRAHALLSKYYEKCANFSDKSKELAIKLLHKALACNNDPSRVIALNRRLGDMYVLLNKYDKAIEAYKKVEELGSQQQKADVCHAIAMLWIEQAKPREEIIKLLHYAMDNGSITALISLAELHRREGDKEKAKLYFNLMPEDAPDSLKNDAQRLRVLLDCLSPGEVLQKIKDFGSNLSDREKKAHDCLIDLFQAEQYDEALSVFQANPDFFQLDHMNLIYACCLEATNQKTEKVRQICTEFLKSQHSNSAIQDVKVECASKCLEALIEKKDLDAGYALLVCMAQRIAHCVTPENCKEWAQYAQRYHDLRIQVQTMSFQSHDPNALKKLFSSGLWSADWQLAKKQKCGSPLGYITFIAQAAEALAKRCKKISLDGQCLKDLKEMLLIFEDDMGKSFIDRTVDPLGKYSFQSHEHLPYLKPCMQLINSLTMLHQKYPDNVDFARDLALMHNAYNFIVSKTSQPINLKSLNIEQVKFLLRQCTKKQDPRSHYYLARLLEGNHSDQALPFFEKAATARILDASLYAGVHFLNRKQFSQAEKYLNQARDTGIKDAYFYLGKLCKDQNKLDEALQHFAQICDTCTDYNSMYFLTTHVLSSCIYVTQQKAEELLTELQIINQCTQIKPDKICFTSAKDDNLVAKVTAFIPHVTNQEQQAQLRLQLGQFCYFAFKYSDVDPIEKNALLLQAKKLFDECVASGNVTDVISFYELQQEWGHAVNGINKAFNNCSGNPEKLAELKNCIEKIKAAIPDSCKQKVFLCGILDDLLKRYSA